ncbi:hypothetical protein A2866_05630 [Candidatus Roizmanbacteria bacterium RIFCSPHIGHO2_01_FULL_39_8]|nr:MAG: hypothetical protein A2866_05630 [Candidatus Roizmanbacteria bacterium RIFCSPHIGHO2_01_FULL_39_8]
MGEFPTAYPDIDSFVKSSFIGDYTQMSALARSRKPFNNGIVEGIIEIMTPRAVLEQMAHEKEIITSAEYSSFDLLRRDRNLVRDLKLVPARSPQTQIEYEQMQKDTFLNIVRGHYINCPSKMTLVREMFPSDLPTGVGQYVVWLGEDDIPDYQVAEFIAIVTSLSGFTLDDIILFERSRKTTTQFAKVAVPEYRHIHMWTREEMQLTR